MNIGGVLNSYLGNDYMNSNVNAGGQTNGVVDGLIRVSGQGPGTVDLTALMGGGNTLRGEILSLKNGIAELNLGNNIILNAKMQGSASLNIGQTLTFEVDKGNDGLKLRPLFTNTAGEENASRALQEASVNVTGDTLKMVDSMMKEGMPIDRNSLQSMNRQITNFLEQNPASIVEMTKLGLEITPESIEQYEIYKNANHQLLEAGNTIANDFADALNQLVSTGQFEKAVDLFTNFMDIVNIIDVEETEDTSVFNEKEIVNPENVEQIAAKKEEILTQTSQNDATVEQQSSATDKLLNMLSQARDYISNMAEPNVNLQGLDSEIKAKIIQLLQTSGLPEEEIAKFEKSDQLSGKMYESLTKLMEQDPQAKQELGKIIAEKPFVDLMNNSIKEMLTLKPEEIQDKEKVKQFYENLERQSATMQKAAETFLGKENPVSQDAGNLQNNLNFMNQMNQFMAYVQLPVKLNSGKAHGDLYVYTNRKNLAMKDGTVSAFLHLDMDHLGPTDVYVAMTDKKVNTKFYLMDDDALDLVEQHMDLLTERLNKRGYQMNMEVTKSEKEQKDKHSPIDELRKAEGVTTQSIVSKYSFDVRA